MSDEVDELIAAWARERPDLPVAPMHIWSRVHRLALYLDQARRNAYAAHDLESWEFDVLAALRRSGKPYCLSPGQLVKETNVTSGTMTNRVDRLVKRGLVVRGSHPEDGRGVLVGLTDNGKCITDAALISLLNAESELTRDITDKDREQLVNALRTLLITQSKTAVRYHD